jgi:hypothetical protein
MNKVKDFNFGYLVDATALGFVLTIILMKTNMISQDKRIIAYIIIAIVVLILMYMFCQDTKITNESDTKAFIKAEQGDNIDELLPKSTKYGIDGVKINGVVYKTPDGTRANITKNGKLKVESITGKLLYIILGGVLKTAPDSSWEPLFDAK